ncbi:glycosyltransferase family 1 protein [Synechocystis sp. LKSZ1]|uniref:glycosyltransferase family 4 protein n=1 Tax=Synechocystis sp. LKSZ1 TaxID=3144951 RepID=UPI00336BFE8D
MVLTVAVDATPVRGRLSGVGFYTLSLLRALVTLQDSENFRLRPYFHPGLKPWLRGNRRPNERLQDIADLHCVPLPVTIAQALLPWPNPWLAACAQTLEKPSLVHGTDHFVYPCRGSRHLLTIHDLTFLKYPEFVPPLVKTYGARIQRCLRYTDAILTFAQSTKQDIVEYLGIAPERIFVTYQASRYSPHSLSPQKIADLQTQIPYDFSRPYFLFVSTLEPRKNVAGLIQAFNQFKAHTGGDEQLVLIGQWGWKYQAIRQALVNSPYRAHIHHLDYVANDWLALFYQEALAFVYPSFYEGFGLPVLEAMNFGLPVITSQRASLPEVVGSSGLLIDPEQPGELALALQELAHNSALRANLSQQSQQRAQQFSWLQTAQQTLRAYQALV